MFGLGLDHWKHVSEAVLDGLHVVHVTGFMEISNNCFVSDKERIKVGLVLPGQLLHCSSGESKKPEMHCRKHCIVLEIMQCNYNAPASS